MSRKTLLDELDVKILSELQKECRTPLQDIADKVGAPTSTVHYRLKRLEDRGIIEGYYAKLNPSELEIDYITAIWLRIEMGPGYYDKIGAELAKIPGIWGVYMMLGDYDFLVLTRSRDRESFLKIIERIQAIKGIRQSSTQVVAKLIKEDPRFEI